MDTSDTAALLHDCFIEGFTQTPVNYLDGSAPALAYEWGKIAREMRQNNG